MFNSFRLFTIVRSMSYSRLIMCVSLSIFTGACHAQSPTTDPTRPLGFEQAVGDDASNPSGQPIITLTSIIYGSDRKIAIINGQSLQVNQTIKGVGATVKKIEADSVTLQQGNKIWQLPLNKMVIRK